jgi:uncharacterized protein YbjT (DUF2867 family)
MNPILVIGAAGRHGSTGATVIEGLRAAGRPARALVRRHDERAERLAGQGVDVVVGDLRDRRTLGLALADVETAYFTWPVAAGIVDAAANFAAAGRAAGLRRVVVMSMGVARPDGPSHLGRAQFLAEEVLEWAGFDCLHLRIAALFFENLDLLHRADILGDGVLRNSFGEVAMNWMSGADAGRLGAAALLHPERFDGAKAVYPCGDERLTHAEIATILGRHFGRDLRHETVAPEVWRDRLIGLAATDDRVSTDMATHISAIGAALRQAMPANDLFERATGAKSMPLAGWLKEGGFPIG